MGRDTVRVVVLIGLVAGLLFTSRVGVAETTSWVRLPVTTGGAGSEPSPTADTVTVAPGDHFWKISKRRLADVDPEAPVAPYWRKVIEANVDNIRSGDPDLIYPGEIVELPAAE